MNKTILIGRLTKDPEVHYTPNQKVFCKFTLAVDRPFLNQDGQKEADFIPIVLWGKSAELAGNSCAKGHRLCVEGRIQVRTYEEKDTQRTVWVTEVIGDRIEFIEKRADAGHPYDQYGNPQQNGHQGPPPQNNNYNNRYNNQQGNSYGNNPGGYQPNNNSYGNQPQNGPAGSPMGGMGTDVPFDEEVPF